ncbi:MAG TPA: sigma-70 family RNA polymerase sigma factor [Balneolaceae bacterium]|nr:sigma-70 family RNA polymerase sigma factor [Balneolaceae bacterium]
MGYKVDDYSELVYALQENSKGKVNKLLDEVMHRLKDYLKVVLNATEFDAEECTQQVFINVYEQIKKGNIKDEKYIFRYLIQACRHEYFRISEEKKRYNGSAEYYSQHLVTQADQIENLVEKDRKRILGECFDELYEDDQTFIEYIFEIPGRTTKEISKHFNISPANARTKKSRIMEQLHYCAQRKLRK